MGLFPSVAYAEANGLVVFFAIAGIPIAITIIALIVLVSLPTKKKNKEENPEIEKPVTLNVNKNPIKKAINFIISAFVYSIIIYLCFIPTFIFPRSNGVFIVNVSIVGFVIIIKVISYFKSRKNI